MKRGFKLLKGMIAIVFTVIIGAVGYVGYNEFVEARAAVTEAHEANSNLLKEHEVKKILNRNIDSIFTVYQRHWLENGWMSGQDADFNIVKPDMLNYATEEFADTTLRKLAEEYCVQCDISFKPELNLELRFQHEQNEEILTITGIQPATEEDNMGYLWTFELVKENLIWKLNHWKSSTLVDQDLKLTREEAEKLIEEGIIAVSFEKEYESNEASGTAYLFNLSNSKKHWQAAISSKDTRFVTDYKEVK